MNTHLNCPKCGAEMFRYDNKGDWSIFCCSICSCRFTIANNDIEDWMIELKEFTKIDRRLIEEAKIFNPSRR